jgi:competence protein ComEA
MSHQHDSRGPSPDRPKRRPLLAPEHQLAIAVLVIVAVAWMAARWLAAGGLSGGLVDIDKAPLLEASFQTDINTAEWTELMQLPEVGETLAQRIVESRNRDGPFTSHDDLRRVSGIGKATLEKLRPYLRPIDDMTQR